MESISWYVKQINRHKLLSRDEELDLARKMREGDFKARQKLINSNLRFVVKMAHRYSGYGVSILDLIQEGNIGLLKATRKFDPERGYRFVTYAVFWIKAQIHSLLLNSHSLVKFGTKQSERTLFFKLRTARNELTVDGKKPSNKELSDKFGISARDIEDIGYRIVAKDFYADSEIPGCQQTYLDLIPDKEELQDEIYDEYEKDISVRAELWRVLRSFNERERYIIINRLMSLEPMTLLEIGNKFSISRERTRQIETSVIKKLRRIFEVTDLRPAA